MHAFPQRWRTYRAVRHRRRSRRPPSQTAAAAGRPTASAMPTRCPACAPQRPSACRPPSVSQGSRPMHRHRHRIVSASWIARKDLAARTHVGFALLDLLQDLVLERQQVRDARVLLQLCVHDTNELGSWVSVCTTPSCGASSVRLAPYWSDAGAHSCAPCGGAPSPCAQFCTVSMPTHACSCALRGPSRSVKHSSMRTQARGREGARARGREGVRERGSEGARAQGRKGARARGHEGARAGAIGGTEHSVGRA